MREEYKKITEERWKYACFGQTNKEGWAIHPSFFIKFWLFNVNLLFGLNYPKENEKKE